MMYRVKDWSEKQHYKDRNPTWIKLHKGLLSSYKFNSLSLASKALAPLLWLLASEYRDPLAGLISGDHDEIAFRVHLPLDVVNCSIKELIEKGYLELVQDDSNSLSETDQAASPEKEDISNIINIEKAEETRAALPKENLEALKIIENFDASIVKHFGDRLARLSPSAQDFVTAMAWVSAGATADRCSPVIDAVVMRQKNIGKPTPPGSLKYFDNPILEALASPKTTADLSPVIEIPLKIPADIVTKLKSHPTTASGIRTWFDQCQFDVDRGEIKAPSTFVAESVERKFGSALRACFGKEMKIINMAAA